MDPQETTYLNHAGTSWPKPSEVLDSASAVFSMDPISWPDLFHSSHLKVANFFHVDPDRLLLTPGCTSAISLAVLDHPWSSGDRIVTTGYEHHALFRTLAKMAERGVDVRILPSSGSELIDLVALEQELQSGKVRLLAMTAACNVTGQLLPFVEAIELAHNYGSIVLIDGAQIAGWMDVDLVSIGVDMFCFAGHKGPQAPWGIGGLYVSSAVTMTCPLATCEISTTARSSRGPMMPGYCDAGSVDLAALAGLAAGLDWLCSTEKQNRLGFARNLATQFAESVRELPDVAIHGDVSADKKMPTVAITVAGTMSSDGARQLREKGLIVSGGLQCAPQAHKALGTEHSGVIRFSFGPMSQESDVTRAGSLTRTIVR